MVSANVNLALQLKKAMDAHTEQGGCDCEWKEGAWEEAVTSPEFGAFEKKLKSLEIPKK